MPKKIILLDSIRSMQNVWAIFRNADSAWFDKVILTWNCPYPPRNDISKTALWAENWIDWEFFRDWIEVIKKLKKEWYKIFSIELTPESVDYRELTKEIKKKIHIINVTQCINGSVILGLYETSAHLKKIGVISGKDITIEGAIAKLMYLLGEKIPEDQFKLIFEKPLRGEMSDI